MKNTLGDFNNHLFEQMECLNDDDLKGEELKQEISRATSMGGIATHIIDNARTVLAAEKMQRDTPDETMPKLLESK